MVSMCLTDFREANVTLKSKIYGRDFEVHLHRPLQMSSELDDGDNAFSTGGTAFQCVPLCLAWWIHLQRVRGSSSILSSKSKLTMVPLPVDLEKGSSPEIADLVTGQPGEAKPRNDICSVSELEDESAKMTTYTNDIRGQLDP